MSKNKIVAKKTLRLTQKQQSSLTILVSELGTGTETKAIICAIERLPVVEKQLASCKDAMNEWRRMALDLQSQLSDVKAAICVLRNIENT